jgi:hypothetical protein
MADGPVSPLLFYRSLRKVPKLSSVLLSLPKLACLDVATCHSQFVRSSNPSGFLVILVFETNQPPSWLFQLSIARSYCSSRQGVPDAR